MKQALIVFVKKPIMGNVKTRLANDIGHSEAVEIYKKLLRNTENVITSLKQDIFIFSDVKFKGFFGDYSWRIQKGNNLGLKMFNAFEEVFALGYDKVNIIGSDCFELSSDILKDSFNSPEESVIGPSKDGGYYLLGLSKNDPEIFKNIEWSTENVFEETKKKLHIVQMKFSTLPRLTDIDDLEDLKKFPQLML